LSTLDDVDFLTSNFTGVDTVYFMVPPVNFFDRNLDITTYYSKLGNNFLQAIHQSGVRNVIHLSGIGGDISEGNGFLKFISNDIENILKQLPGDISIITIRPVGLYYNLFFFINAIKTRGAMVSVYEGDVKEPWVSPSEVATAIVEEIINPYKGRKIRYVASDEITPNEVAKILGEAIGKPDLKWVVISDEQWLTGLIAAGMNPKSAKELVEMNASKRNSLLYEDYYRNRPILGKVKLAEFAKEFAEVYNSTLPD